jgi:Domain of unknown function (DUF1918)
MNLGQALVLVLSFPVVGLILAALTALEKWALSEPGTSPDSRASAEKPVDQEREEAVATRAEADDELVVRGRHVADEDRMDVIVEVLGGHGEPLLRRDDGHRSEFFPSSDTLVQHHPAKKPVR